MSQEHAEITDLETELYSILFDELDLTDPYYEDLITEIVDSVTPFMNRTIWDVAWSGYADIDWREAKALSQNSDDIGTTLQTGIYLYLQNKAGEFVESLKEFREKEKYLKEYIEDQEEQISDWENEQDSDEKYEKLAELKDKLLELESELDSLVNDFKSEWDLNKSEGE